MIHLTFDQVKYLFEQIIVDHQLQVEIKRISEEHQVRVMNKMIEIARKYGFYFSEEEMNAFNDLSRQNFITSLQYKNIGGVLNVYLELNK